MSQLSANTADARRARVRRTVLWLGVAALAVYGLHRGRRDLAEAAPVSAARPGSVTRRALIVAGLAFVFCFSLVPLYRIACEVVFGIKLEQGGSGEARRPA